MNTYAIREAWDKLDPFTQVKGIIMVGKLRYCAHRCRVFEKRTIQMSKNVDRSTFEFTESVFMYVFRVTGGSWTVL